MFEDKTLICKNCGKEYVFTAEEQELYAAAREKDPGFPNDPGRCRDCRLKTKKMNVAKCSVCGKEVTLPPFGLDPNKPIICSDCFGK